MGWGGIVCDLGACLCNIPNITNKNSYEQQIEQGNKIGLILKKKKLKGTHLHCTCILISLVPSVANEKKKKMLVWNMRWG